MKEFRSHDYTDLMSFINSDRIADAMLKMEDEFQAAEDKSEFTEEGLEMAELPKYRDIPTIQRTPEKKAEHDYSRLGSYENPYARQSRDWMTYHMTYFDLVAIEGQELNAEIQGEQ